MRLVSFESSAGPRIGGVRDGQFVDLNAADAAIPTCMKALVSLGEQGLQLAQAAMEIADAIDGPPKLMAPIASPRKVICVGVNYADHARELGNPVPDRPLLFIKPSTALVDLGEPIALPRDLGPVHHEVELALLIGERLQTAAPERVVKAVRGIGIALDLTLRGLQDELKRKGHPWERAK